MYWYQDEINAFSSIKEKIDYDPRLIFYGSSSIRLWKDLESVFKLYKPINLGFGGSSLAACAWFYDQVMAQFTPDAIIIYAGDNDLADRRHPEEVILFLQKIRTKIRRQYPEIPVTFISIKPSPARWHLKDSIVYTNKVAQQMTLTDVNFHYVDIYSAMLTDKGVPNPFYFVEDGLHLNLLGYELWAKILLNHPEIFPKL